MAKQKNGQKNESKGNGGNGRAKNNENGNGSTGAKIALGVGVVAAMAAGAYFLYGTKEGAKKRVKIKGWMLKAKGEVMEKMENLKEVNEDTYNALVTAVMKKYEGLKNVDKAEVAEMVSDLRRHWKNIKRHIGEDRISGTAHTTPRRKSASKPKKTKAKVETVAE